MTSKKPSKKSSQVFSPEERAAMREYVQEKKGAAKGVSDEGAVLEKIAAMAAPDRALAERLHALVRATAPSLSPRLWYGMPAYAKDGNVVCFFQGSQKFKSRYSTLGFSDKATLDYGNMWPTSFALTKLTGADEKRIVELLKRAAD